MPSKLPRINFVLTPEQRDWLDAQRLPCESAASVIRRLIAEAMERSRSQPHKL